MTSQKSPSPGILNLERGLAPGEAPRLPGLASLLNSATYDFPIIVEIVRGARAEILIRDDRALEPAYIAAAKHLAERGAIVISRRDAQRSQEI